MKEPPHTHAVGMVGMKLGISTWSLLGLDVYAAIEKIGDSGAEFVELWGEFPHAYHDMVDKGRIKDVISSYSMAVTAHAPFTDLNVASPFQPVKRAVEKTLEGFVDFAVDVGASVITFHPGSVHNEGLAGQALESAAASLRKMVSTSGGRVSINLENQVKGGSKYAYPVGSTVESLTEILSAVPGSRCTLDVGHAHASGIDPLRFLGGVGDRLTEIHLSDNAGSSDDHLVPGQGPAPLRKFMDRASLGETLVCLELNPHRYGPE